MVGVAADTPRPPFSELPAVALNRGGSLVVLAGGQADVREADIWSHVAVGEVSVVGLVDRVMEGLARRGLPQQTGPSPDFPLARFLAETQLKASAPEPKRPGLGVPAAVEAFNRKERSLLFTAVTAGQLPLRADRRRRHETGPDHAMGCHVGQRLRVGHARLAAGNVLDMVAGPSPVRT